MKRTLLALAMTASLAASTGLTQAATFTYHGTLQDFGRPAEGSYDIELTLYSAANGGSVIGGPLIMNQVPVHHGSFSTRADFGPLAKSFSQAYVEVKVRAAGRDEFVPLDTRSQVTSSAESVCPGAWTLQGNAGNPAGSFLGTTDADDPLIFMVGSSSGPVQVGQFTSSGDATKAPGAPNVLLGYSGNSAAAGIGGATIAGGGSSDATCGSSGTSPCINSVQSDFGTVGGGDGNTAGGGGDVVGGGFDNSATGGSAVVSGGFNNHASGLGSTVVGGGTNMSTAPNSAVAGGVGNIASGADSSVAGGTANTAAGDNSVVVGGSSNSAGGDLSFAAGNLAVVRNATQAGNSGTCSANLSNCGDYGTFVWADSNGSFRSSGPNQFLVQATGGVGINTSAITTSPASMTVQGLRATGGGTVVFLPYSSQGSNASNIHYGSTGDWYIRSATGNAATGPNGKVVLQDTGGGVGIGTATVNAGDLITTGANGAHLTAGGVWTNGSSRTFKEAFSAVDVGDILERVLALPIQTWFYKVDHAEGRHMGPMAEDFSQAFGLGSDDKHVGSVDESGVAFAAIQGLNKKIETSTLKLKRENSELRQESTDLRKENSELRGKLDDLTARLSKLEAQQGE
ncbi:MAG: hypothetical protein P4L92_20215 [Rudaea sp.]|nr:hypothetical protein [Rudaea sp.]